jgi:hypothetical protein
MSSAYSGVQANIIVGTTDLDVQGWTADVSANVFDSTTTADGGWDDETPATKRVEWSFDFFYNKTKPPFGTLGLTPGATLANMHMYINLTDGVELTGTGLVKKVSLKVKVKDGFVLTASGVNKGPWTLPS